MIVGPPSRAGSAVRTSGSHYCPRCLRRVGAAEARCRTHREACRSGPLDVVLLTCPSCDLVLTAEIDAGAAALRAAIT